MMSVRTLKMPIPHRCVIVVTSLASEPSFCACGFVPVNLWIGVLWVRVNGLSCVQGDPSFVLHVEIKVETSFNYFE